METGHCHNTYGGHNTKKYRFERSKRLDPQKAENRKKWLKKKVYKSLNSFIDTFDIHSTYINAVNLLIEHIDLPSIAVL